MTIPRHSLSALLSTPLKKIDHKRGSGQIPLTQMKIFNETFIIQNVMLLLCHIAPLRIHGQLGGTPIPMPCSLYFLEIWRAWLIHPNPCYLFTTIRRIKLDFLANISRSIVLALHFLCSSEGWGLNDANFLERGGRRCARSGGVRWLLSLDGKGEGTTFFWLKLPRWWHHARQESWYNIQHRVLWSTLMCR